MALALTVAIINLQARDIVEFPAAVGLGATAVLLLLFAPTYPLLRGLGLFGGDWWQFPTLVGLGIATTIYAACLYGIGKLIDRRYS